MVALKPFLFCSRSANASLDTDPDPALSGKGAKTIPYGTYK